MAQSALTRRELLERGALTAAALGVGSAATACGGDDQDRPAQQPPAGETRTERFTGTLRVLSFFEHESVIQAAEEDLGFKVAFELDPGSLLEKVYAQPESFDIYSGFYTELDWIWASGNLQPVEISRIERWEEITPVFKLGRVDPSNPSCTYGEGDAPFRKLYVDPERSGRWQTSPDTFAELDGLVVQWLDEASGAATGEEPRYASTAPSILALGSVVYNEDVVERRPEEISWAELFNPTWKGRVALGNLAGPALLESALAARALGLMTFENIGNLTKEEVESLLEILSTLTRQGHFHTFWNTFEESVELMASGEVVVEPMPEPFLLVLKSQDFPARFAVPQEGFEGIAGCLAISARVTDPATLQACHDYIDWWYSGRPGALNMEGGTYQAVLETSRPFLEPAEWAFWVEGKPAPADREYPGAVGASEVSIREGQAREGGSYAERFCRIAGWSSLHEFSPLYAYERLSENLEA